MNRSDWIMVAMVAFLFGFAALAAGCTRRDSASQLYKVVQYQNR